MDSKTTDPLEGFHEAVATCSGPFPSLPSVSKFIVNSKRSPFHLSCSSEMKDIMPFGLNFRFVMPVIFVPTPPRYFALPRIVT